MAYVHLTAVCGMFLFLCCRRLLGENAAPSSVKNTRVHFYILFGAAILIRLTACLIFKGHDSDTACFAAWASRIVTVGPSGFYSPDVFTDYPPGYLYLLYPAGLLQKLLQLPYLSTFHLFLLRLVPMFCDIAAGYILYRETSRRENSRLALLLSATYLFNPVILLNSAVWGQADSVYTLLLVIMVLSLIRGKMIPAYFSFFIGLIIKPQMLIFAPVLFAGILDRVFLTDFSVKRLLQNIGWGLLAILTDLLLILPFGIGNVIAQYTDTVSSCPYAAVNAFNFWGLLGLNWIPQTEKLLGISYRTYGSIFILIAVLLVLYYSLKHRKETGKYALIASVLMSVVFVFSVRMHERYIYPALVLMLFSCIYYKSKRLFLCYAGFSLLNFYNGAFSLFFYDPSNYDRRSPMILLCSAGMLLFIVLLCEPFLMGRIGTGADRLSFKITGEMKHKGNGNAVPGKFHFLPSQPAVKLAWIDFILMLALTVIYACFAFHDLGDREAPETYVRLTAGDSLTFVFDSPLEDMVPASLSYYVSLPNRISFQLETKDSETSEWYSLDTLTLGNVFTWNTLNLPELPFCESEGRSYLRLTLLSDSAELREMVFFDSLGDMVRLIDLSDYTALFDESSLCPTISTYRDSMYFDEIYHARTAYEFTIGSYSYENTHPPLGKILISLGIRLFGMNPFGWRFMGTLFGVFMVPLVYLFGKELTGETVLAFAASSLYAFDFMHFTQTRLATIDTYIAFFVILMYYFMLRYCRLSFYSTRLSKTWLPLGACGISMGLGIACKWTGIYAGMGLAVLFFGTLALRYKESVMAMRRTGKGDAKVKKIAATFLPKTIRTILFCLVFFVLLPGLIYLLSYIPFRDGSGDGLWTRMLRNQQTMLNYHSGLNATHPYSSSWYEWPLMIRPIWYYSCILSGSSGYGGMREGISAFGNPLVWWIGIPAALYMFYLIIRKRDRTALFLMIGYLAQYLPWFFVTRITFIYHYFPGVIFVVLMIVYSLKQLKSSVSKRMYILFILSYCLAVFALFLLFLPVLSGRPVDAGFVDQYLRWMDGWVLTAR